MKHVVFGVMLVAVAALVWVLAFGFRESYDPQAVPSVLENKPAPPFALTKLDGGQLTLAELRGRPIVVNFWSSWCEPCKAEHRTLQAAAKMFADRAHFVGVVYQDTPELARSYLQGRGSAFPQLLDPDSRVAIDYGVAGVPESFFIDGDGVVRQKFVGPMSYDVIRQFLEPLLASAPRSTP